MSLLEWTGNPFVDSGIAAIMAHSKKRTPADVTQEDLQGVKELIKQVYVTPLWKKAFHSIFTGNYSLLQNSYKTDEKRREKFYVMLDKYLAKVEQLGTEGTCIACGRRTVAEKKNRTHVPLSGAKSSARGFFPAATDGADYCETCAFVVQFSLLAYYACGKYFDLLHSNSAKVMRRWAARSVASIQEQIALNNFTGCFNEGYTNPENALFHLAQDLILKAENDWQDENPSLRFYHFTNYIQAPELAVYDLPAPVFKFLAEVKGHPRFLDWRNIVNRGFYFMKKGQQINLSIKGKPESEFKNSKNKVYQDLLAGRSILRRFLNTRLHKAYGDFSLLEVYLIEVLAMDKTRIETVKKVADEIAEFIRQSPKGKNRLRNLEASVKFRDFCNVLRRIGKERIALNAEKPLLTLDEFAEHLFPEGALTFGETRYLILFRLYEQLHDWLLEQGITAEETEDDIVEVGDDKPLAAGDNDNTQLLEGAIQ